MPAKNSMPSKLYAGDEYTLTLNTSKDSSWAVNLYLQRMGQTFTISGSHDSGTSFIFTITTAISAKLAAGGWTWSLVGTKGTDRETVTVDTVTVMPDPSKPQTTVAKKILDLIEDQLQGRLTEEGAQESISYLGTSITLIPVQQLHDLRLSYRAEVQQEHRRDRIRAGKKTGMFRRVELDAQ